MDRYATRRKAYISKKQDETEYIEKNTTDLNPSIDEEVVSGIAIEKDISSLKGKEKQIAELSLKNDLKQADIAKKLGVTQGYISSTLKNIKTKLDAEEKDEEVEVKPIVKGDKIGRNDPCPCGSGKKYKNCCMNK